METFYIITIYIYIYIINTITTLSNRVIINPKYPLSQIWKWKQEQLELLYIYIYNIDRRHKKWGMREWEKNSNLIG